LFARLLAVVTLALERIEEPLAINEHMARAVASERDPRGVRKGAPDLLIGERGHKDEG
jgi:predicted AlkP superfamily phosphohydrolase/phosphomutase